MKNRIGILSFLLTILLVSSSFFHPAYSTSAGLLPNAVQQFFDNNGNPLSSGTVTTYEAGTSTLKTTWRDSAGVTANTNPIVLDAGGKAIIYGEGTYRQLVKDRNGNTVWDAVTSPGGGSTPTDVGDGNLVGTILPWGGLTEPNQYRFTAGQAISRNVFSDLFTAITQSLNVVCTSASNTLTGLSDTTSIRIGSDVELPLCVAAGTTVTAKTGSTVTLSNPATVSINSTAIFFPFGNGNGNTTFNLPDLRGYAVAGRDNMNGTAAGRLTNTYFAQPGQGVTGGSQSNTIQYPQVLVATGLLTANSLTESTFAIVQPTITLNYIIKTTSDVSTSIATGVASINGMTGTITCSTGLLCTGNTIQVSGISQSTLNTVSTGQGLTGGPCTVTCTVAVSPTYPVNATGGILNAGISTSVGSNILSISLTASDGTTPSASNPVIVPFRSDVSSTGTVTWISKSNITTLNIVSGATMGVPANTPFRFWIAAINDASTIRLCGVNTLSATGSISSYNILPIAANGFLTGNNSNGAADNTGIWYCTGGAAVSLPYTLLGYVTYESGLTTPGLYISLPNIVQLYKPEVPLPGSIIGWATDATQTTQSTTNATYTLLGTSLRVNYTQQSGANLIRVNTFGTASASATAGVGIQIGKNTNLLGVGQVPNTNAAGGTSWPINVIAYEAPSVISSNSFQIYGKASAGTVTYPATSTGALLEVQEIQR